MPEPAGRLSHFTESVIREMSRVALRYQAVNLAQGFPDFDPPGELIAAAERALREGHNQYSLTWGSSRFRAALAHKQTRFMGLDLDPDAHITVTCGSTEAMMAAVMTACSPGDRVIVFTPFYENYVADTMLTGAVPIYVPLHPPAYTFDPDELRAAFRQGPRALILCNPSNPTGRVFSAEEMSLIAELAQEHDAFVLTDEVYEHIVYEPHRHRYMASLPGMFGQTLSCSSLSKTYAITGWRLGYVITCAELTEAVRKVHDFLCLAAPTPLQEAAVTALNFPADYYDSLRESYAARRDLFLGYLDRLGLAYNHPQGAYYVMVDVSPLSFEDDTEFCIWLAKEIGVAAVPGSSFFVEPEHRFVRLNFAKRPETLRAAGERLLRLRDVA